MKSLYKFSTVDGIVGSEAHTREHTQLQELCDGTVFSDT